MTYNPQHYSDVQTGGVGLPIREFAYYLPSSMALGLRLPAYLGQQTGNRAHLGGGSVAVLTDSSIPCAMLYIVCPPEIAPSLWDFSFLRGSTVVVYYRTQHRAYAAALYGELKRVGPELLVLSCTKESAR